MTRKKKGFLTFIFSLMPGAGEMYMGFMKRGVSVMCAFLGWIGICGVLQFGAGFYLAPVIWFYSFFSVHNLASLPDEEFYQIEVLHSIKTQAHHLHIVENMILLAAQLFAVLFLIYILLQHLFEQFLYLP